MVTEEFAKTQPPSICNVRSGRAWHSNAPIICNVVLWRRIHIALQHRQCLISVVLWVVLWGSAHLDRALGDHDIFKTGEGPGKNSTASLCESVRNGNVRKATAAPEVYATAPPLHTREEGAQTRPAARCHHVAQSRRDLSTVTPSRATSLSRGTLASVGALRRRWGAHVPRRATGDVDARDERVGNGWRGWRNGDAPSIEEGPGGRDRHVRDLPPAGQEEGSPVLLQCRG